MTSHFIALLYMKMADMRNDPPSSSPEKSSTEDIPDKEGSSMNESQRKPEIDNSDSEDDHSSREALSKDDDVDNRGAYTAATRGFPPSRTSHRGPVFGSSSNFGGNPFAVKSTVARSSLDGHSGENSSWPGLTPSKLGATPAASPVQRPVLRPPQLNTPSGNATNRTENTPSRSPFPLNPPRLGNPFGVLAKAPQTEPEESKESVPEKAGEEEAASKPTTQATTSSPAVKFVPLGTPNTSQREDGTSSSLSTPTSNSFVFGQNLRERVVDAVPNHTAQKPSTSKQSENGTSASSSTETATNGTSEMLFSTVLKKEQSAEKSSGQQPTPPQAEAGGPAKSLSEAAREYEESRAVKRKYEAVAVVTGEEDEANVLQISCKLFAYDKVGGSWAERGRGQLRLNDKEESRRTGAMQSRVVMRTHGSLRVVLNTKIWAGMAVDRPSPKSVRLTAMDNGQIKVFLVMATPKEAELLHNALEWRVASQRSQTPPPDQDSVDSHGTASVEEARSGLESSSFPPEPTCKKGRSSGADSADQSTSEGTDLEL